MANLQIKGIDENLYEQIKKAAVIENRSLSQHVLYLIKSHIATMHQGEHIKTPAQALLDLAGSWEDDRTPDEIIAQIKEHRKNSEKLQKGM